MALTVNKLSGDVNSVTFQYSGESVTVEYYPGKITEKTFAQLRFLASTDVDTIVAGFSMLNGMLASLIKTWDVLDDDGDMFPSFLILL